MSAPTPAPTRPSPALRFSARDLLNTAVFAVIFIVVVYAIGMLGVVSPVVWLAAVPLQVVAGGIVVMLFFTRVRHAGMVALFATVVALFYLISGNTPLSSLAIVGLGLAAEVLLRAGGYRSKWAAIWAYTVFALSFFTPLLPLLTDRQAYFASLSWTEMGTEYVQAADALLSPEVIGSLAAAIAVAGFLGALLGSALLRKHFVRAGLA
ncbi:MAG: MptD family putative ECF transporter S component [Micropruina sp.]|uniref:MptD family putative ECF transporter S component n=1 Tax=Micropruina sp. TaxID=2737536 RepID=UPI0039E724CA